MKSGLSSEPRIEDELKIWLVDLGCDTSAGAFEDLLPAERAQAARFGFERDKRRFTNTRSALRRVLGSKLGVAPQKIRFAVGAFGKPYLAAAPHISFNVSHSEDLALIAIGPGALKLGVDVERCREIPDAAALASSHFTSLERGALAAGGDRDRAFLTIWTRKEAAVKALGLGLGRVNLANLHVGLAGATPVRVGEAVLTVATLEVHPDFVAGIAVDGHQLPRINLYPAASRMSTSELASDCYG